MNCVNCIENVSSSTAKKEDFDFYIKMRKFQKDFTLLIAQNVLPTTKTVKKTSKGSFVWKS